MPGDYTRLTFDPRADRAMVLEQQGRVHLDADFNELAAILERRLRVETYDFAGPAVVPASEPASFQISFDASGQLVIAPGRMYVDGLLAENHGVGAPTIYEPVWGEPENAGPTPYGDQPYAGSAIEPQILDKYLLYYLVVWQREVTAVEDSSLLEPALGVDTCTRIQTVWQVRRLGIDQAMTCASDWSTYAPWLLATQQSSGLLSSQANQPPAPTDPCAVAPVGGYRGLENRLYRVEIHDGGAAGQATFKWSRDNGAVASRITGPVATPTTTPVIPVERLGRDTVLRFQQNDWVEAIDDSREFSDEPGLIGQVLATDSTANTVTLSAPLPALASLGNNPRLRRWDQQNGLTGGVIPVPAALPATIALEDGVEVTLDLAPADATHPQPEFMTGDWWVFAARAATASVETLVDAPPRGIRRHYARLAIVTGDTVTGDCRVVFPGECNCEGGDGCECTACVTPESHASGLLTIAAAVAKVGQTGGRVCLAPGRYELTKPLLITGARSLTIAGAGAATVITYRGPGGYGIGVVDSVEVSLERFALAVAAGAAPDPAPAAAAAAAPRKLAGMVGIALMNTIDCRVDRCFVLVGLVPGDGEPASFGIGDVGIGLRGWALRTRLVDNVVLASTAIGDLNGARADVTQQESAAGDVAATDPGGLRTTGTLALYTTPRAGSAYLLSADLAITDNLLVALRVGIDFGSAMSALFIGRGRALAPTIHMAATRIADNLIVGAGIAALVLLGLGAQELPPSGGQAGQTGGTGGYKAPLPSEQCAADAGGRAALTALVDGSPSLVAGGLRTGVDIGGDVVVVAGNVILTIGCGIVASSDGLVIRDNQIVGSAVSSSRPLLGILLGADRGAAGGRATITGNWIREFTFGGVVAAGQIGSLEVSANRIVGVRSLGIATLGAAHSATVGITGNTISQIGPDTDGEALVAAVLLFNAGVARVSRNTITDVGSGAWVAGSCFGVLLAGCETAEIAGNQLARIGPSAAHTGWVYGIASDSFGALDVRGNIVTLGQNVGRAVDIPLFVSQIPGADVALLMALVLRVVTAQFERGKRAPVGMPDLGVHGNALHASGWGSVAYVSENVNVTFADNRCVRGDKPGARAGTPVVQVQTSCATIVSANRVEGSGDTDNPVIDLTVETAAGAALPWCTVLGNIATGPIALNGHPLPTPWAPLNVFS